MSIDSQIPLPRRTVPQEDDEEWEDVPEENPAWDERKVPLSPREGSVRSSTPSSSRVASPRRRKATKTILLAQSQTTQRRLTQVPPQKSPRKKAFELNSDKMQDAMAHSAATSVQYISSVLTHALGLLKKPLGFIVFLYLLAYLLGWTFVKIRFAFEPICWIPGISTTPFCRPPQVPENVSAMPPQRADYPRLVEIQSSSFEQLLDGSVGGPALSLDIKKAEMATRDLITLVKHSGLKSREHLAQSLTDFVLDAKKAGKGLAKLTARINGAVDNVMAINDYALQTIEGAKAQEPHGLMRVFPLLRLGAEPPSRAAALAAFQKSMDVHAHELQRLILEVEVSSSHLDALDMHLDTLHEICTRENLDLGAARDALLADLWTILGGNRDQVRTFNMNLELLRELGEYRRRAAAHVAAASQTLQAMGEDMEDLRERVAAPELLGDRMPVEVHMKSIRAGIERLKEQRVRAKEREERLMNRILGLDN